MFIDPVFMLEWVNVFMKLGKIKINTSYYKRVNANGTEGTIQ